MRGLRSIFATIYFSTSVLAQSHTEYDYVICGGGTAGLAVANRLTESSDVTVLVIEAGVDGTIAAWDYQSVPQVYANGRVQSLPAGKAVGGSSQINGKVYSRPDASSINDWETTINGDWSWNTLLPFSKSSESLAIPSEELQADGDTFDQDFHGFSGPVNVSFPAVGTPEFRTILEGVASNLSIPQNNDFNGGQARGLSAYPAQFVIKGEREQIRESSKEAYYLPAAARPNLKLLDQTTCLRISWADGASSDSLTAVGVEIANYDNQSTITARREVILSAGAYRSPTILEYSGVGNPDILVNHNIETRIDLPGVGENLQDQMQGNVIFSRVNNSNITFPTPVGDEITTNYIIHLTIEDVYGTDDAAALQDRVNSSISSHAIIISTRINGSLSADQISKSLQVQYDAIFNDRIPAIEVFSSQNQDADSINFEFWPLIPLSRGNVHISGGNAEVAGSSPVIDNNWGIVDIDWDVYVAAGRYVRRFFATEPLASEVTTERKPGLNNLSADASDDDWISYWADNFRAGWHPIGSAAMLPREWGGVVDAQLKVYGTANVRVVDASVIPFNLGGHPTSTVYALAERAAKLILGAESAR